MKKRMYIIQGIAFTEGEITSLVDVVANFDTSKIHILADRTKMNELKSKLPIDYKTSIDKSVEFIQTALEGSEGSKHAGLLTAMISYKAAAAGMDGDKATLTSCTNLMERILSASPNFSREPQGQAAAGVGQAAAASDVPSSGVSEAEARQGGGRLSKLLQSFGIRI